MHKLTIKTLTIFFLLLLVAILPAKKSFLKLNLIPSNTVFAETEEEEEEDEEHEEDREEEDHEEDREDSREDDEVEYEYLTVPSSNFLAEDDAVPTVYTTIDWGYDKDSDGDKLVDAIDPNPTIPQSELFTDDDGDSVPNANDAHKGEDDYLYQEFEDVNQNGIADFLE